VVVAGTAKREELLNESAQEKERAKALGLRCCDALLPFRHPGIIQVLNNLDLYRAFDFRIYKKTVWRAGLTTPTGNNPGMHHFEIMRPVLAGMF
jgi:hypothetical protein